VLPVFPVVLIPFSSIGGSGCRQIELAPLYVVKQLYQQV
jgi:hypothetical protein